MSDVDPSRYGPDVWELAGAGLDGRPRPERFRDARAWLEAAAGWLSLTEDPTRFRSVVCEQSERIVRIGLKAAAIASGGCHHSQRTIAALRPPHLRHRVVAGPPLSGGGVPARRHARRPPSARAVPGSRGGLGDGRPGRGAGGAARGRVFARRRQAEQHRVHVRTGRRSCWISGCPAESTTRPWPAGRCTISSPEVLFRPSGGGSRRRLVVVRRAVRDGRWPAPVWRHRRRRSDGAHPASTHPRGPPAGTGVETSSAAAEFAASLLAAARPARPATARAFAEALARIPGQG